MTNETPPELEDSGLDNDDYRSLFLFKPRFFFITFGVIFIIILSTFYLFQYQMRSNSNKKIQQVKTILSRAEDLPEKPDPITLQIEKLAQDTDNDRHWIVNEIISDSFASKFESQLQNRFLRSTTYLDLPDNWRNRLPPELQQWAEKKKNRRFASLKESMNSLKTILDDIEKRINRLQKFRKKKDLKKESLGGELSRYDTNRKKVLNIIERLRETLQETKISSINLPKPIYQELTNLIDPLTIMSMHFRNFSAFSSAPAAYYHADRLLHDALRIDPKNPAAYYYLGKIYRKLNLHNIASEHMVRALRYDQNFKQEKILNEFRQRLKEDSDNPRRVYDLAFALHEIGKKKKSKKHLKKVLKLERGTNSMVKVLAQKRLSYIQNGEPTYSKLTLF